MNVWTVTKKLLLRVHRRLLPSDPDIGWMPYLWLVYLGFFYIGWFFHTPSALEVTLNGLVLLAFLVLYFHGFWCRGKSIIATTLAIAALGALVGPWNAGASVFFIFAAGFVGQIQPRRRAVVTLLVVQSVVALEAWLLHLPWNFFLPPLVIGTLVATVNLYYAELGRKRSHLKLTQAEVQRLATLAERERIARELHDLLGHTLSLITLKSELAGRLLHRDPQQAQREIADVERVSRDALAQVRQAVSDFRAHGLQEQLANARLALEASAVRFDYHCDAGSLPPEIDHALAMCLREAVTNIIRHADAHRASARFYRHQGHACLEIDDNGKAKAIVPGAGLKGMRERVSVLGGSLDIQTGSGTCLNIDVPLPESGFTPVPIASAQAKTA